MTHVTPEKLAEFVRKSLPAAENQNVEEHVASCGECRGIAGLYAQIVAAGGRERLYEPTDGLVRSVKAAFAATEPVAPLKVIFELLFDSFRQPVMVGARASVASARQLLYRIGTVYVDMRVDAESGSQRASLVGQLLDSAHPGHPVVNAPIELLDGRKVLASTTSNNNGEFQVEFEMKNDLSLSVTVDDKAKAVYLPITGIESQERVTSSKRRKKAGNANSESSVMQ